MYCGTEIVKFVTFFLNFTVLCICMILIARSSTINVTLDQVDDNQRYNIEIITLSNSLIIAEVIISLITFVGCWGVFKKNTSLLKLYGLCLLTMIIVETVILGYMIFDPDIIKNKAEEIFASEMKVHHKLRLQLECCGLTNEFNWFSQKNNASLSAACCEKQEAGKICDGIDVVRVDCANPLISLFIFMKIYSLWIYIGFIIFTIGLLFSVLLIRNTIPKRFKLPISI